ncbi:hypothetical protein ABPG74_019604 [Tetrahymena malaccensis]
MQAQQPLQSLVQQLIDESIKLQNSIFIQESSAKAAISKSETSEKEISDNLKSLISQKLLIDNIEFKDGINSSKELNFTIRYSLGQYQKEEFVSGLINKQLKINITTKKEKKQINFFEYQDEYKDLLSDKEKEQIKQNQEATKTLFEKIKELEIVQNKAQKIQEEQDEQIKELKSTKEKYQEASKNAKDQKDQEISKKDGLEKEFSKQTKEKSIKQQKIDEGKAMMTDLAKKLDEQEKNIKSNEDYKKLQQVLSMKEEEFKKNQNQIEQLENELQTHQNEIKSLQQKIEDLEVQYLDKQNDHLESEKQIFKLRQRIKNQENQIELQLLKLCKLKIFDQTRRKSQ